MNMNITDKYELLDGTAIIDNNYVIVTANEPLYRFMGISITYTIIDIIHQVDLDDFIDVANSLSPNAEKTMVIRMKRFDNSYRWMLTKIKRSISINEGSSTREYIELHLSDILSLEKHNNINNELISTYNHIMAIEGNINFSYDCKTSIISFYSYLDNTMIQMSECPLSTWIGNLIDDDTKGSKTYIEIHHLQDDFINCKAEFFYTINSCYFSFNKNPESLTIKASTIFNKMQPITIVGSIHNNNNHEIGYSRYTNLHMREHALLSFDEIKNYIDQNILLNSKCQLSIILMQIDNLNEIINSKGEDFFNQLYSSIIKTTTDMVGARGVVGSYKTGVIYIAIKNITSDLNTRSFIESLRTQISWNNKIINDKYDITFSIGISRCPINGTSSELLFKKALRALDVANEKEHNRFIIYLENAHGEIE